jgi:ubiquinone/menaquinone biosynthesis C-methylase UbiE
VDTRDVAAAYDIAAPLYPDELAPGSVSRAMLERFSPLLPAGAWVIDIGCGAGRSTRWLGERGYAVMSIDVSLEMLRRTRWGRPDAWIARADMRALPVASASFDGLTAFFSLVHIPKAEVPRVLQEFRRVLRRGGTMLVSVRRGRNDTGGSTKWADGYVLHFTDFVEDELEELLGDAGFRVVARETCEALMDGRSETHLFRLASAV